jgi:hypothetical protein
MLNSTTLAVVFVVLVMWGVAIIVFTINLSTHEDGVGKRLRGEGGVGSTIETTPSGYLDTTAYSETTTTTHAAATAAAAVSRHLKTHIFYYPW